MTPEIESMRMLPHMGTFRAAKLWVSNIADVFGRKPFALHFDPCGVYFVTHKGEIIGKGFTYENAIMDARNTWKHETGELTLDGMMCS